MRNISRAALLVLTAALAACGSEPAAEPAEQIVVREPSDLAIPPAMNESPTQDTALAEAAATDAVTGIDGEAAFAQCAVCHSIGKGEPSDIGPNLHGIMGQKAASVAGYSYSPAIEAAGITWTEAEMDSFLADPLEKIPGTKMASGGVTDGDERAAIIAYMMDASGS